MRGTEERILDAATEVFWEELTDEISLVAVARRAGVSKQTVLRRFGSRDGLFAAAVERSMAQVRVEREDLAPGDLQSVVSTLLAHYERTGDGVLRLLSEEARNPAMGEIADRGRAFHADWCARVFAPQLRGLRGVARGRRLAQLITACDVYTWKLLRRDCGLSRRQTEIALRELIDPLSGSSA